MTNDLPSQEPESGSALLEESSAPISANAIERQLEGTLADIPHDVARESQAPASIAEPAAAELDQGLPKILTALKHRDFRFLWTGNFLSNIGTWMQGIAQSWLVLQLTDSAYWLGVVTFAQAAPMLLFTMLGGVIADHVDKRKMLIRTQIAMMASSFLLAILTYNKAVTVEIIIVLAFATGVASSLSAPAQQAMLPMLVPRNDLTNAIGLNSAQFNMSRVLGPTLGGFGIAWFGMAGNFFLNGLSFLAVIGALAKMHYPAQSPISEGSWVGRLKEGLRYTFEDARLRVLVFVTCVAGLTGICYLSFVPVFARNILGVGERGLGILMAFSGLGAFFGAVTIAYLGKPRNRGRIIGAFGTLFFCSVLGFSFSDNFLLSSTLQFVAGYSIIMTIAVVNARLQLLASDEMRGRTMSIYATAYLGLPPIGSFAIGYLSQHIGAQRAVASLAVLGFVLFATILATHKDLRNLN